MAKTSVTKAVNDFTARMEVFKMVGIDTNEAFKKINNQGFGVVVKDADGNERFAECRVILHGNEVDADGNEMTAQESLDWAAEDFAAETEKKKREAEEKAREKEEKKKRDAEERERKKAAKKKDSEEE